MSSTTLSPSLASAPAARAVEDGCVEDRAARRCRAVEAVDRSEGPGRRVAEADDAPLEQRELVPVAQRVERAEALEPRERVREEEVRRDRLARRGVALHGQDVPAAAREGERERPAGAAGPHDHGVVFGGHRPAIIPPLRRLHAGC
jgi:hypothetical protein